MSAYYVFSPDKNKASVQVLVDHADVWHVGKESVDMRIDRRQFARVQAYFSECAIVIQDMEAHVQAAEAKMFPTKKAEQSEWIKAVIQAALPNVSQFHFGRLWFYRAYQV